MEALTIERKAELKVLLTKTKLNSKKFAIKYGLTTRQVAGLKRSLTCAVNKSTDEVTQFKAIEKKAKGKVGRPKTKNTNGNGIYENYEGVHKNNVRDLIVTDVVNSRLEGKFPTLCAKEFRTEKKIEKELPNVYDYTAIECVESEFKALQQNLVKENFKMNTFNGYLIDYLKRAKENDFAHINADYCCQLFTVVEDIKLIVQNNLIKVNGSLFLTLNLRGSRFHMDFYNEILGLSSVTKVDLEDNTFMLTVIDSFLKRLCGFNYSFSKPYLYNDKKIDDSKGANMIFLRIKRLK